MMETSIPGPQGAQNLSICLDKRYRLAVKAQFCRCCMNPEVIFTPQHLDECKLWKKALANQESPYTCNKRKCATHFWICRYHKQENTAAMKKAKDELQKKGLVLGFPAVAKPPKKLAECSKRIRTATTTGVSTENKQFEKGPRALEAETVTEPNERNNLRRFFSTAKKKGMEVDPEPKGIPVFMFFAAKGTSKCRCSLTVAVSMR